LPFPGIQVVSSETAKISEPDSTDKMVYPSDKNLIPKGLRGDSDENYTD
jgi:hypothetical protein